MRQYGEIRGGGWVGFGGVLRKQKTSMLKRGNLGGGIAYNKIVLFLTKKTSDDDKTKV